MCSADGHLVEPMDLWVRRLPKQYRDRAPRGQVVNGGIHHWFVEGRPYMTHPGFHRDDGTSLDDSVDSRLNDLDDDGIWAETIYPNLGLVVYALRDVDFAMACARVYNDFLAEAYLPHGNRELGIPIIPMLDIDATVQEMERVAAMGLKGFEVPMVPPAGKPYHLPMYDPVWETAQRHGWPVSFHLGTGVWTGDVDSREMRATERHDNRAEVLDDPVAALVNRTSSSVFGGLEPYGPSRLLASLVAGGVLERFPNLHVICVETGAGWLAHVMQAMDTAFKPLGIGVRKHTLIVYPNDATMDQLASADELEAAIEAAFSGPGWPHPLKPSEYIRRQVHATFMDDPSAVALRHFIGIDALLWATDYPHEDGTWPQSQAAAAQLFAGVDPDDRAAITGGTLAKLFAIEVPAG
jgi:predicted TIM-barrel fold metal-dependent hydrolase